MYDLVARETWTVQDNEFRLLEMLMFRTVSPLKLNVDVA